MEKQEWQENKIKKTKHKCPLEHWVLHLEESAHDYPSWMILARGQTKKIEICLHWH